jgi:hypothetical protein
MNLFPPLFHEEVGVSHYLHQRSFCAEKGGLLPLDECIGSLLDGSSKQHRPHTDGAVQPFYYFLLTQSVDTSASFVRSSVGRRRAALCLRYFALHERHDAPHTHTGIQTGGKTLFSLLADRTGLACIRLLDFMQANAMLCQLISQILLHFPE